MDPRIPPSLRMLVLRANNPPGTHQGIRQHSPVLVDSSHNAHDKQQQVFIIDLQSTQQLHSPALQSRTPCTLPRSLGLAAMATGGC